MKKMADRCDLPKCWNCHEAIPLPYLGESCPYCNASLTSADYDTAAVDIIAEAQNLLQGQNDANLHKSETAKRVDRFRKRHPLLSRLLAKRLKEALKKTEIEYNSCTRMLGETMQEIECHAAARYYATQWFRETNIMLAGTSLDASPFTSATYRPDGSHRLREPKNKVARGKFGEYIVFDMISSAIERGELGHAEIIPSLYVRSPSLKGTGRAYSEIDMLLITQRATYAIEAKSLHGKVACSYKRKSRELKAYILREASRNENRPREEDSGPSQNQKHVEALKKHAPLLGEQFFNVVCYVNNGGFEPPSRQGVNNIYLTTNSAEEGANVLHTIKGIEQALPVIRSEEELVSIAMAIRAKFSDSDGSKRREHANRMNELRKIRKLYE